MFQKQKHHAATLELTSLQVAGWTLDYLLVDLDTSAPFFYTPPEGWDKQAEAKGAVPPQIAFSVCRCVYNVYWVFK